MSVSLVTGFAGESHITSEQIARFNASVFGSGEYVATGAGKTISASLQSANTVRVMPGDIMMKGRHIVVDSAQDLSIENGSQALKRNDLIVCRYEKNSSTGVETASLDVIKGTPGEIAVDPNYVSGDLLNGGALINEMPLFRISLDGLAVQEPVPLFSKYLLRGDQIADNAITTEKIANGTITASDLSSDLAGRITDLEAAWDSVSHVEIAGAQCIKYPDGQAEVYFSASNPDHVAQGSFAGWYLHTFSGLKLPFDFVAPPRMWVSGTVGTGIAMPGRSANSTTLTTCSPALAASQQRGYVYMDVLLLGRWR